MITITSITGNIFGKTALTDSSESSDRSGSAGVSDEVVGSLVRKGISTDGGLGGRLDNVATGFAWRVEDVGLGWGATLGGGGDGDDDDDDDCRMGIPVAGSLACTEGHLKLRLGAAAAASERQNNNKPNK